MKKNFLKNFALIIWLSECEKIFDKNEKLWKDKNF